MPEEVKFKNLLSTSTDVNKLKRSLQNWVQK